MGLGILMSYKRGAETPSLEALMLRKLVASLLLVIVGTLTLSVGAGLLWGLGAALLVGGTVAAVLWFVPLMWRPVRTAA